MTPHALYTWNPPLASAESRNATMDTRPNDAAGAAAAAAAAAAGAGAGDYTPPQPGGSTSGGGAAGGSGEGTSRVDAVQQQIDGVKTVMQDNIGQMLSNIERSQTLESTTEGLAQTATQFNRAARSTRKHFWWQNFKVKLALGGGCLLLLIIILASSGAFSGGGGDASPPPPPPTYG